MSDEIFISIEQNAAGGDPYTLINIAAIEQVAYDPTPTYSIRKDGKIEPLLTIWLRDRWEEDDEICVTGALAIRVYAYLISRSKTFPIE